MKLPNFQIGLSVSGAGDADNDGYADLIVGAGHNDLGGGNAGRVYVYTLRGDPDGDGLGNVCDPCLFDSTNSFCCVIPGYADGGGEVNIGDGVYIVKYIFKNVEAPICCDEGDADGGGEFNIGDAVFIVKFIFQNGAAPSCTNQGGLVCP